MLPAREGGLEGGGAALVGRGVRAPRPHLDPPPRQLAILLGRVEVLALNVVCTYYNLINFKETYFKN